MRNSRLSKDMQVRLMEHFVAGTTARTAASLVGVNKSTAAYYYHRLRELVFRAVEDDSFLECEIEVDESYFGGRRKSKRGRGAAGKVPVFGILKRRGRVYTRVTPDTKSKTLMGIMEDKIVPDSIVYTDAYHSHNLLVFSEFKDSRINHSELLVHKHNHIYGIENFWNQAKQHNRKFNGIPRHHFPLFSKECEWRFNNPNPKRKKLNQWVKHYMG
jgi:transposase